MPLLGQGVMGHFHVPMAAILLLVSAASSDNSYTLKPPAGKQGATISLILIQGESSPPGGYRPFAEAVQAASPLPVWVGVPEFVADTPEPLQFGSKIKNVTEQMVKAGMSANRSVILGHSLGGVMAQQYVTSHVGEFDALVLYGATVLRKYRTTPFGAPVLTLDGTLDGLLRVTRQAEAWWHQVGSPGGQRPEPPQPLILLDGLNHWSISSGPPPSFVRAHDLSASLNETVGHAALATALSSFITASFGAGAAQVAAVKALSDAYNSTARLVAPLVEALELEGSTHVGTPCDSDYPTNPHCEYPMFPNTSLGPRKPPPDPLPPVDCTCGSAWVMETAQRLMGAVELAPTPTAQSASIVTKDAFHDVSDTRPFHLPHIFTPPPGTACTAGEPCKLLTTTVTMPILDRLDELDTGLYPISARELRTKLKSRQSIWQSAGVPEELSPFNTTDRLNASICRAVNAAAYQWALEHAGAEAHSRFEALGTALRLVEDTWSSIGITGPTWIHDELTFTPSSDGGRPVVDVAAPYFATENKNLGDVIYLETVGYHCARVRARRAQPPRVQAQPPLPYPSAPTEASRIFEVYSYGWTRRGRLHSVRLDRVPCTLLHTAAHARTYIQSRSPRIDSRHPLQIASCSHRHARWNGFMWTGCTRMPRRA